MQAAHAAIKPVHAAAVYLNLFKESSLMDDDHSPSVSYTDCASQNQRYTDNHTYNI